jgi:two-component SAPR family response regulator
MPRKLKVVVAHHEKLIVDTVVMILKQVNVDAIAAHSGVSALELVLSTSPDVAILCIVPSSLDDLNGVYAAVVVRALMPACRILLFPGGSGSWVVDPLTLARTRGYQFELIPEPIHPDDLFALLEKQTAGDIEPIRRRSSSGSQSTNGDRATTQPHDPDPRNFVSAQDGWAVGKFFRKLVGRE